MNTFTDSDRFWALLAAAGALACFIIAGWLLGKSK